jgi:hypothetical protein
MGFFSLFACAPSLEHVKPIAFSSEDRAKTKVAIFSTLTYGPTDSEKEQMLQAIYSTFTGSLIFPEKRVKSVFNPFEVGARSMKKDFGVNAGRKMGVDFVLFLDVFGTARDQDKIGLYAISYKLIDVKNERMFKESVSGLLRTDPSDVGSKVVKLAMNHISSAQK